MSRKRWRDAQQCEDTIYFGTLMARVGRRVLILARSLSIVVLAKIRLGRGCSRELQLSFSMLVTSSHYKHGFYQSIIFLHIVSKCP